MVFWFLALKYSGKVFFVVTVGSIGSTRQTGTMAVRVTRGYFVK